jgi:hypothetical protein
LVRADEFTARGGLPVTTMNEDLAFGYLACAAGTPIDPLPVLEVAEVPGSVPALIRQARQWFWSYPEYPVFAALAREAGLGTAWSRTFLAAQGLARGMLWLGQSPAVAATLALPLADRRARAATAATAAAGLYLGVPFLMMASHPATRAHVHSDSAALASSLAACLIASVGPWWCCANALDRAIRDTAYQHDKTER